MHPAKGSGDTPERAPGPHLNCANLVHRGRQAPRPHHKGRRHSCHLVCRALLLSIGRIAPDSPLHLVARCAAVGRADEAAAAALPPSLPRRTAAPPTAGNWAAAARGRRLRVGVHVARRAQQQRPQRGALVGEQLVGGCRRDGRACAAVGIGVAVEPMEHLKRGPRSRRCEGSPSLSLLNLERPRPRTKPCKAAGRRCEPPLLARTCSTPGQLEKHSRASLLPPAPASRTRATRERSLGVQCSSSSRPQAGASAAGRSVTNAQDDSSCGERAGAPCIKGPFTGGAHAQAATNAVQLPQARLVITANLPLTRAP
jgi:hypothetical protein